LFAMDISPISVFRIITSAAAAPPSFKTSRRERSTANSRFPIVSSSCELSYPTIVGATRGTLPGIPFRGTIPAAENFPALHNCPPRLGLPCSTPPALAGVNGAPQPSRPLRGGGDRDAVFTPPEGGACYKTTEYSPQRGHSNRLTHLHYLLFFVAFVSFVAGFFSSRRNGRRRPGGSNARFGTGPSMSLWGLL
jgi:hypothetical protein